MKQSAMPTDNKLNLLFLALKKDQEYSPSSSVSPLYCLGEGSFLDVPAAVIQLQAKQMNGMTLKNIKIIEFAIEINFYLSVIVLITAGFLSISDSYSIFEFNENLYGALDNNLRMMMVYLAATEIIVFGYCLISKKFQAMVLVGFFLILMIGSIAFYGEVNSVAIDDNFSLFFLYTGLSHSVFGVMKILEQQNATAEPERAGKSPE